MARIPDRSFNPSVPVYVRRFFVASGRHWEVGTLFDWRRLAVNQRRVRQLFDVGKLMHLDDMPAPDYEGLQAREAAAYLKPAAPIAQEARDDDIQHVAVTAPAADDGNPASEQEPIDDLDGLNMAELRAIADAENAPTRVSRAEQREAIRQTRRARAGD
jgi:hypothetical protein